MDHRRSASLTSYPPLTVWLVTINREITREEFQRFVNTLPPLLRDAYVKQTVRPDASSLKTIIRNLLPRILMKAQGITEDRWSMTKDLGNTYIESPDLSRQKRKVMGLNVSMEESVIGFAFAFGRKHQVVNIGIDLMRMPQTGVDAEKFIESHMHKLAPAEESFVVPALPDDVKLRRLCIMLTLKEAYTKALGQPKGFDLSRIECNVPNSISVDGRVQVGWEFRLFRANIGVVREGKVYEEVYQCACAIFRGHKDRSEFIFSDPQKDALDKHSRWLSLATVQQVALRASQQYPASDDVVLEKPTP